MQVFLYEFATGGGLSGSGQSPAGPLLVEGKAMIQALAADFSALPDTDVVTTRDSRLPAFQRSACGVTEIASSAEERLTIQRLAAASDWTLLIAPETANALFDRCLLVESAGGRLLSSSPECIKIATSKQTTVELLSQAGVPVPQGFVIPGSTETPPHGLQFPLAMKPVDGCASHGVRLIRSTADWQSPDDEMRVEEFIPGLPASVAVLCGPAGNHALPACEQRLSSDGLKYLGGRLPLAPEFDNRARHLALAAVQALPRPVGYLGVDLVLADSPNGRGDRVIEINPRLTTSYIGLRAASRTNLAAAILAVATGRPPNLCFTSAQLEFTASGAVIPRSPDSCSLAP